MSYRSKHPHQWSPADVAEAIADGHYLGPSAAFLLAEDQNLAYIQEQTKKIERNQDAKNKQIAGN